MRNQHFRNSLVTNSLVFAALAMPGHNKPAPRIQKAAGSGTMTEENEYHRNIDFRDG